MFSEHTQRAILMTTPCCSQQSQEQTYRLTWKSQVNGFSPECRRSCCLSRHIFVNSFPQPGILHRSSSWLSWCTFMWEPMQPEEKNVFSQPGSGHLPREKQQTDHTIWDHWHLPREKHQSDTLLSGTLSDALLSDTLLSRPGNQGLWENNMWMVITYCQKTALGSHEASLPGQQRTYNLSQK